MLTKIATFLSFAVFISLFSWQVWIASMQPHDHSADGYRTQRVTEEIKPQSADERIALYTEWLAGFTALLAVVSAVQGFFLFRADKTARIAAEAARDTASKMSETAEISQKQFLINALQTDISEKQHAVGRMQFLATHRPLLRVRVFRRINTDEEHVMIKFTIVNVGSSKATIIESYGKLGLFPPNDLPPPFYLGAPQVIEPST